MTWPNGKNAMPLTGSGRLRDAYLGALADLADARAARREAEKTGDVQQHHLDDIVAAEDRVEEARKEYLKP